MRWGRCVLMILYILRLLPHRPSVTSQKREYEETAEREVG